MGLLLLLQIGAASCHAADTLAFISDLNGRYGTVGYHRRVGSAVDRLAALRPAAAISTGDMIAGQRQPKLHREWLDRMWQAFDEAVFSPLAQAGIPLAVTPGNHDGSAFAGYALERERFQAFWQQRKSGLELLPGSEWPRRYGAWLDSKLLIAFDGTRPGSLPDRELEFLRRMLITHGAQADRIIVFSHLPLWPLARGREKEIIDDPELLKVLHQHGVTVYASGHHHLYYAGVDAAGMVHLAVGALGGNGRRFTTGSEPQPHSLALLEITEAGGLRPKALVAPEFRREIVLTSLPERITGPLGTLVRIDLAGQR